MTSRGLNNIYPNSLDQGIISVSVNESNNRPHHIQTRSLKYDTSIIENRKVIILNASIYDTSSFSQFISCEFTPDEVILKSITGYIVLGGQNIPLTGILTITTDLFTTTTNNLLFSGCMTPMMISNTYYNAGVVNATFINIIY